MLIGGYRSRNRERERERDIQIDRQTETERGRGRQTKIARQTVSLRASIQQATDR